MDEITAIRILRDNLRTNLSCAYEAAGGNARDGSYWIFAEEPISTPKYPIVELKKADNPSIPIDIGNNYMEFEQLFVNIFFYTKNGFKITVSGTEYKNESLVEYYLGLIKTTLKAQFSTLHTAGAKMYKHINTSPVEYSPETQLFYGFVRVRVAYFNR